MSKLLYLCHRIPFPPNKGDKIRSYHWFKHFHEQGHQVYLGAFVDDPEDRQFEGQLERLTAETYLPSLNPLVSKVTSLKGLLTGRPLTDPYYYQKGMADWVDHIISKQAIDTVLVYSSSMAQYVMGHTGLRRVIDFVDVDSAKWTQYAKSKSLPMKYIYAREGRALAQTERSIAKEFDASVFVSEAEAEVFAGNLNQLSSVTSVTNGVDCEFFDPNGEYQNPYDTDCPKVVFTGALDYWANVEGVVWYATRVFPKVREQLPTAEFHIVGSRPVPAIMSLETAEGVKVSANVPDIRGYIRYANMVAAPLKIARGIQNKVLEAMALCRPLAATGDALDGINISESLPIDKADDEQSLIEVTTDILKNGRANTDRLRGFVLQNHSWLSCARQLEELLFEGANQ